MAKKRTQEVIEAPAAPEYTVTVTLGDVEREYTYLGWKIYDAKMEAIKKVIEEFNLPGRAYEYLSGSRKDVMIINCKGTVDRRTLSREEKEKSAG